MKKIGLVLVVAALGVAGYVLVNRYSAMSESGNVVIQGKKVGVGGSCKHDGTCKSGKCKDGTCRSNSKVANGLSCDHDGTCESGLCTAGTCRAKGGSCTKDTDCGKSQYCATSMCRDKKNDGEDATKGGMPFLPRRSSCKSNTVDTTTGKCCCTEEDYNDWN